MSSDPARMIAKSARKFDDPAERAAYLDRVCRGIVRLREEVEKLLATEFAEDPEAPAEIRPAARAAEEPDAADATPRAVLEPLAPSASEATTENAGDAIGRYRLVKELGEGGFGTVWLADQFVPVRRQVALKIIKLGMDTLQVVARFEQERQALALMDHSNVARVLDAGATASGRPYFVMDLVQGVPIHEYCDRERLPIATRLELFAQVCAAVQHAHMKGIIHRDLKPSNVLVSTRDGRPHATVIDFGIAKATSAKLTERSLVTEAYQVIGTLQYMSPEQSQAQPDIDTRTDVYSLGVILYELLTGATPFDAATMERKSLPEILRMILEEDPSPPSVRITAAGDAAPRLAETRGVDVRRLAPMVRGDLDWIVMKAIEKDRARRYESAEALAADVRRHLAGEAVVAAPPSAAYRLRKLLRRHRGAFASAAAVAATLVAGVIAFAWQAGVAEDERDDAVAAREAESVERRRAEDTATFMESLFAGINPESDDAGADSFKEQLTARLDDLSRQLAGSAGDPLVRARLQAAVGRTLTGLAEFPKAEAALRSARDARREHLGADHPDAEATESDLAYVHARLGRFDEACAAMERLQARRAALPRPTDGDPATFDHHVGMIYQHADRIDDAIRLFEAARDRATRDPGPDTAERLLVLHTLGAAYRATGRSKEAVEILRDVYARRVALLGPEHADTLMGANSLAVALAVVGLHEDAAAIHRDVHEKLLRRFSPDHPRVLASETNLAGALGKAGQRDEEIRILEGTHRRVEAKFGAESPDSLQIGWGLAAAYRNAGRTADSVRLLERILPAMTRLHGGDHPIVTEARTVLVRGWAETGGSGRAADLLASEIAAAVKARGDDDAHTLRLRTELAAFHGSGGRTEEAAGILADVVPRATKALGERHEVTLDALFELGQARFSQRRAGEAIAAFETVHRVRSEIHGFDHEWSLAAQGCLGAAYWLEKKLDRSVPILEDAMRRSERALGPAHAETLSTAENLAANLRDAGRTGAFIDHLAVWLPRIVGKKTLANPFAAELTDSYVTSCMEADRRGDAAVGFELVYADSLARLGPDDPEVLNLAGILGACLWSAGKLDRSVPLFEDIVPRLKRVAGVSAPETLQAAANLAVNLRDAGRLAESLAAFEEAIRDARAGGRDVAEQLAFLKMEYLTALARAGRRDDVIALAAESVAAARTGLPAGSPRLAGDLVAAGAVLLESGAFAEAEPLLRECIAIREKVAPDAWNLFNARSLLGAALTGQRRFAEAEPLVTGGYEGMAARAKALPAQARPHLGRCRDRVLRLYTDWHAAEPGRGHDARLGEWQEKFRAAAAAEDGK